MIICKSCNTCNNEMCDTTPPHADSYILLIDTSKKSLQHPSQNFVHCVNNIIKRIKKSAHESGITRKIKLLISQLII